MWLRCGEIAEKGDLGGKTDRKGEVLKDILIGICKCYFVAKKTQEVRK